MLEPHVQPAEGEFIGDSVCINPETGYAEYRYICPTCHNRFILEDNREFIISDAKLKETILQNIEYAENWPRRDLVLVVNVYKIMHGEESAGKWIWFQIHWQSIDCCERKNKGISSWKIF